MAGGAPTKYKKEYCKGIVDYFRNFEPFDEIPVDKQDKEGNVTTTMKKIPGAPPSLTKYATSIDVCRDTLHEWRKVHTEFSYAFKKAKGIYEDLIIDGAMTGLYNAFFTKLVMFNRFEWSDKVETKNKEMKPELTESELNAEIQRLREETKTP